MKKILFAGAAIIGFGTATAAPDPAQFPGGLSGKNVIHDSASTFNGQTVTNALGSINTAAAAAQATANSAVSGVTTNAAAIATETDRAKAAESDNATTAGAAIPKTWIGANSTSSVTGVAGLDSAGNVTAPVTGDVGAAKVTPIGFSASETLAALLDADWANTESLGYHLFYNASPSGSVLYTPTVACAGNNPFGSTTAYGAFCYNVATNPALETYAGQIKVQNVTPATTLTYNLTTSTAATSGATTLDLTPTIALKSGYTYTITGTGVATGTKVLSVSQDSSVSSTTVTLSTAITADIASGASIVITGSNGMGSTDSVGLYVGVENTSSSYSGGQWAVNFLSQDNLDGGGTGNGMAEFDQNNFNCDNPDPDGNYYTLSSSVRKVRSDHSACPGHSGVVITGLAGYTSEAALNISGVGSRAMWEDGINMIGGYIVGSSEIRTNTLSAYNWKISGSHKIGIDMSEATYGYAPIHLARDNVNGRIMWDCPKAGCATNITSKTTGISPQTDGTLALQSQGAKFLGGDNYHQGGVGIDIALDGSTTSVPNDWSYMTWSDGAYNFSFTNGANLTSALVMNQTNATFGIPIVSSKGTIHTPVAYASLPSSPSTGEEEWCSDCYAASNSNKKLGIPVWYDGTNWTDSLGYTVSH